MRQGGEKIPLHIKGVVGKIGMLRKVKGEQRADCQQLTVGWHQAFYKDFSPDFVHNSKAADTLFSKAIKVVQELLRVTVAEAIFG